MSHTQGITDGSHVLYLNCTKKLHVFRDVLLVCLFHTYLMVLGCSVPYMLRLNHIFYLYCGLYISDVFLSS